MISSRRDHDRIDDSSSEDSDNVNSNSSLGSISEEVNSNIILVNGSECVLLRAALKAGQVGWSLKEKKELVMVV